MKIINYGMLLILVVLLGLNQVSGKQSMLTDKCDFESIPQIFLEGHQWVDIPSYSDRNFWGKIPAELKKIAIKQGEKSAQQTPVPLTGYDYLQFKMGNSYDQVSQKLLMKKSRLEDLILAELVDGQGRFMNEICSSVWDLCALSNWTGPEAQYLQTGKLGLPALDKTVVDELAGEISGILAWSYYFFDQEFNKIDPNLSNWIVSTVRQKFLVPNLEKYDFYWMCYQSKQLGYQTPWISYNWLISNLLIEKDNIKRQKSIYKTLECLDSYYKSVPQDGGCANGPEIWQYSTGKYFEALEILEMASVGEIDNYMDDKLKAMGEFICHTYINDQYVFNFSESASKLILPASLIFRMGEKVDSKLMMGFGSSLAQSFSERGILPTSDLYEKIRYLLNYQQMLQYTPETEWLTDVYLPESQIVVARTSSNLKDGFYFGLKGGNNGGFANQNDAGSFVLYANGTPLVVDPGKINQTAQAMGDQRYSIWANQSSWHNLPTINGYMQESGAHYSIVDMTHEASNHAVKVELNLALAYNQQSKISEWQRSFSFSRSGGLEISDRFALAEIKGETYVSFVVFSKPVSQSPGLITFKIGGKQYEFSYKASQFNVAIDEISTATDQNLSVWGENLYRIVLKPVSPIKSGSWNYSFKQA